MNRSLATLTLLAASCGPAPIVGQPATESTAPPDSSPGDTAQTTDPCEGVVSPDVVVNELVASNIHGIEDLDGDRPDWVELVNRDTVAVELGGWGLSDDADAPLKWVFPSLSLEPGEHLLVFASGKDLDGDELHAGFSLSVDDEPVVLWEPSGCAVDLVTHDPLYRDISLGRTAADPDVWGYFMDPTPGEPNATESRPGFAQTPRLSPPAGVISGALQVSMSSEEPRATLRWTADGGLPDADSALYDAPVALDASSGMRVVRARAWVDGLWPSRPATASYTQDSAVLGYGLPVVSVVVDPFDLWDEETGIYAFGPADYSPSYPYFGANFWEDWERDLHIEVFEADGELVLSQDAGVKIHGGYTRAFNQKNLRVIARSGYGSGSLDHAFFPLESQDKFKVIVLEGVGDWCPTHTENAFVDMVFRDGDGQRLESVETQAWEPTVVYLNGTFWGLYAFREKLDEHYIAERHGADPDALDRIECTADGSDDWWRVSQGDWEAFDELEQLVATEDLAQDEAWEQFKAMVDIDNLASTVLAEAYGGNSDWWDNNLKLWRERSDDGRWRWMVFDIGHSWQSSGYDHLGTSVSWNGPGLPVAAALRNDEFRALLANQGSDFLNTSLESSRALAVFDEMHARIEPVIDDQYALWCGQPTSVWESQVASARNFVSVRDEVLWSQLQTHLGLSGTTTLSMDVQPAGAGAFKLTVAEVEAPFSGRFFTDIPVTVTAVAADGYSFVGWADEDLGDSPHAELVLDRERSIVAIFE